MVDCSEVDCSDLHDARLVVEDGSGSKFDRLFSVLADQRRRFVLYYLQETSSEVVPVDEMVLKIVDWETENKKEPTEKHQEEVEIALHHHHLPKLDDHGIIDFDPRSEKIRFRNDISKQEWLKQAKKEELNQN